MNILFKQLINLCAIGCLFLSWNVHAQTVLEGRVSVDFSSNWKFRKYADSVGRIAKQQQQTVNLPHSWNIADVMDDTPGYYRGATQYQNTLRWKTTWQNKRIVLHVGAANQEALILVNGKEVKAHRGGYTAFNADITDYLHRNENARNTIAIQVNNRFNQDIAPLSGDFTFFGGIYRKVSLLLLDQIHFADPEYGSSGLRVNAKIDSRENATINLDAAVQNASTLQQAVLIETTLVDADGVTIKKVRQKETLKPHSHSNFQLNMVQIEQPRLWSPELPYLYRLITRIYDSKGRQLDRLDNSVGFRWFSFDPEKGFFLNGKPLKLIGASRHQDFKGMGNAVPDSLQVQDLVKLKAMGGNFLRVAHYPQDPAVLKACDSLGLLASVEIPLVNEISESPAFADHSFQMQKEMIRQYFNHPSIIIWGYMNEIFLRPHFPKDKDRQEKYFKSVVSLAQQLETLTRKEDSTRYTMIANHGNFELYHRTGLTKIPMLVGWNLYPGWYGGKIADFGRQLEHIHQQLPGKPLLVTEYGADADYRILADKPIRFDKSLEYAVLYHQGYLNELIKKPFVAGGVAWNLSDFNSETREESMPHINTKGLLTWDRKEKNTYFLYQAYLRPEPFIKIGVTHGKKWGVRTDADSALLGSGWLRLPIFSNADSVELLLDGVSLGARKPVDRMVIWPVNLSRGSHTVKARAFHNGKLSGMDESMLDCEVLPYDLKRDKEWQELRINVGDNREYIDSLGNRWFPDQPYERGSWGYVKGEKYRLKNTGRENLGTDVNIRGTGDDPLFQTQLQGLESYEFDLPNGDYEIELFFAELDGPNDKENLLYDLEQREKKQDQKGIDRVFDIRIGDRALATDVNVRREVGAFRVLRRKFPLKVHGDGNLAISFIRKKGEPMLNAIRLKKINQSVNP
ncbi:glycoside hydrolase family 2 TIM barrel-domain containing protein [Sphingobacterium multivorum]|uniref:glycoside hydrolase family 2 TIM barrel-domain containing protein n=1 Tax=Sphingobacterium multivorum TaxID=28454 RepID=UPI00289D4EF8|nr:glycoside hydrolase family 2 TIM barrel-domain containing protein [Sphingobacterium multivorum]